MTNREIAEQLGLKPGGVRRRLRATLAIISAYVSRGRAMARSAIHGLLLWLYLRRFGGCTQRPHGPIINQIQQAGIVAVMAVAAAALVVTHQASPSHLPQPHMAPPIAAARSAGLVGTVVGRLSPSVSVAGGVPPLAALPSLPAKLQVPARPPVGLPAHLAALPSLPVKLRIAARLRVSLPAHLPAVPTAIKLASAF